MSSQEQVGEQQVNVAEPEKAVVDCLDHPEYAGGLVETAKGLWVGTEEGRLDVEVLTLYAERMGNRTIFKRLGYLVETLELPVEETTIEGWQRMTSSGYSILDPLSGRGGKYNSRWQLKVNLNKGELLDWRTH